MNHLGVHYFENFISSQEHDFYLDKVYNVPRTKWTVLSHRKLQLWGAKPIKDSKAVLEKMPVWLSGLKEKIEKEKNLLFNQCLVNEYEPGQGILPHEDGPCYEPLVATISLGCYTILHLSHKTNKDSSFSLLLEPKSLLLLSQSAYHDYLHGIDACYQDDLDSFRILNAPRATGIRHRTQPRVSLTFRKHVHVIQPKFLKF